MAMIKSVLTFSLALLMQHDCLALEKNEVIRVTLDGQTYQAVISQTVVLRHHWRMMEDL
jgi:hypothetical protein